MISNKTENSFYKIHFINYEISFYIIYNRNFTLSSNNCRKINLSGLFGNNLFLLRINIFYDTEDRLLDGIEVSAIKS